MYNKKYKNDIFLVSVIFLLSLTAFVIFKSNLKDGSCVNVIINGKVTDSYSLSEDTETTINTAYGANVLVIENGEAYIKNADCPDKICVAHKRISKSGETIVCLPHKLVVEITEE